MSDRPNVLIILCDQMRAQDVGCYGGPVARTPSIDAMAREGCCFEHGITNNPVCVPARSILLSGQHGRTCTGSLYNHAPWWPHNPRRRRLLGPTLPELLRDAGYSTTLIGKWHVDPAPGLVGFQHNIAPVRIGSRATFSEDGGEPFEVPLFSEDYQLHRLRQFLAEDRTSPFFLYYNIYWPHMPLAHIPLRYQRMYDREQVILRDNVWRDERMPYSTLWMHIYLWEHLYNRSDLKPLTGQIPEEFDLRDLTALYYGAITWVDDIVGRIMDMLAASGMLSNTIVLFLSDHGDNLGSHWAWNKDRFWEESIRIPFIVRWPGQIAPQHNRPQQAQLIDVLPTVLDLCGLPVPEHIHGTSLCPVLTGSADRLGQDYAFIETGLGEQAVRSTSLKFAVRTGPANGRPADDWLAAPDDDVRRFLFDLAEDPCEQHNLAGDARYTAERRRMEAALANFNSSTPWLDLD